MGRLSKIRRLDLEREVLELRQKGFGPQTIAKELNKRHNFAGSDEVIFTNVYNFLKSVPEKLDISVRNEMTQELYIEPLTQMKQDLADLRGPLLEKAKRILSNDKTVMTKEEMQSLEIYVKHFEEMWDRIAKIENLLKPEETIKANNVYILNQYNQVKEMVNEVIGSCESCSKKFMERLQRVEVIDATVQ